MDIQKQIAFEKFQAKDSNCDYEELKKRLDHCEKLSGHRYLPMSPRHEAWLVWDAAWQAAQAVQEGFVVVPVEMSRQKADEIASDHWNKYEYSHVIQQQGQNATGTSIELARLEWCRNKAHQIMRDYKAMIEGMEQKA